MNARKWPNGLGWTIRTRHGDAEVCDRVTRLLVSVPVAPARETIGRKSVTVPRCRVCEVPLGTDPVVAVRACQTGGLLIRDDGTPGPAAVSMLTP